MKFTVIIACWVVAFSLKPSALDVMDPFTTDKKLGTMCDAAGDWTQDEGPVIKKKHYYYPGKEIDPDTKISHLNLAMSHDSGSVANVGNDEHNYGGNHPAVTQDTSLVRQFIGGVTVFDVRVKKKADGQYYFYHEWAKGDCFFDQAVPELKKLAEAAVQSESFCLIKLKGDENAKADLQKQMDQAAFEEAQKADNYCTEKLGSHPTGWPMDFDSNTQTFDSVRCRCYAVNDKTWVDQTHAIKAEANFLTKIVSKSDKVVAKIVEKFHKICQEGEVVRLGFTNTGVANSPLCQAYGELYYIGDAINTVLKKAKQMGCSVIFGTDSSFGMLRYRRCRQLMEECELP